MNPTALVPDRAAQDWDARSLLERLDLMERLGRTVLAAPDSPSVLRLAADGLRRMLACDRVMIATYDRAFESATVVADSTDRPTRVGLRVALAPAEGEFIRTGATPMFIPELSASRPSPALDLLRAEGAVSLARVPMTLKGGVVGSLSATGSLDRPLPEGALSALQQLTLTLTLAVDLHRIEGERASEAARLEAEANRLAEVGRRLELAIAATGIALWEYDGREDRLRTSNAWRAQLGYRPDEWTDDLGAYLKCVHPDDRDRVSRELSRLAVLEEGQVGFECRAIRRDGECIWLYILGHATRQQTRREGSAAGIQIDITGRKRLEAELQASNRRVRDLWLRLEAARERERAEMAREVHDEFGQLMTSLTLDLGWTRRRLEMAEPGTGAPAEVKERLAECLNRLETMLRMIRALATALHPRILDDAGLLAAIAWLAQEFREHNEVDCHVELPSEEPDLTDMHRMALFRIVQEALTNVSRHAGASRVDLRLRSTRGRVRVEILDNGRGIRGNAPDAGGQGLVGMRERAELLGGRLQVGRVRGGGTRVLGVLPRGAETPAPPRNSSL